jgi:hypothetical protein
MPRPPDSPIIGGLALFARFGNPPESENHELALKRVNTEMALHVLAYNLTRVMNIMGTGPLVAAMRA